jgi:hypothetical protein
MFLETRKACSGSGLDFCVIFGRSRRVRFGGLGCYSSFARSSPFRGGLVRRYTHPQTQNVTGFGSKFSAALGLWGFHASFALHGFRLAVGRSVPGGISLG